MGMETLKWPTRCLSLCNSKRISFPVHVRKDPTIFLADFPTEICPRDVLNTELCIFYEWYNHVPEAHWEFTRIEWTLWTELRPDSPEPKIHFQESGKYTYKVTLPEVGCPKRMSMEVFWPGKNWPENWRSGFQVWMLLSKRRTTGMKYEGGCLSLPIRHRKRILKV